MNSAYYTYSGVAVNLMRPDRALIHPMDILQALSGIMRYNGATRHLWSVAHHTCAMLDYIGPDAQRVVRQAALVHDFPEYVLGDLTHPIKRIVAPEASTYALMTTAWENAICERFGLGSGSTYRAVFDKHVNHIDRSMWFSELAIIHPTHPRAGEVDDPRMRQAVETYLPCTRQEIMAILGHHITTITGVEL